MKKLFVFASVLFPLFAFAQSATWSENIACILYTHCTGCHNPNGIAPSSFINYQQTLPYRLGIQIAVNNKIMPPYPPDINYQRYVHERILTQEEIDLINDWVNNGAPEGTPSNAPTPPVYTGFATMTDYDLELQMPDFTVNSNSDVYRFFVLPANLTEDMFIESWEVIPGNINIVHHVGIFSDTTNVPFQLDANDTSGPGYTRFGDTGSNASVTIGAWTPGQTAVYYPDGFGVRLHKNAAVLLQVHYPSGVLGKEDSTKIRFKLRPVSSGIRELYTFVPLTHFQLSNGPLRIPANEMKTFNAQYNLNYSITVFEVTPHMHLIGKSIKSFAVTPNNDTLHFIHIPDWDFHWQGSYFFRKPIVIPAGSKLYAEATYDNTANNPKNPNSPPKLVTAGWGTEDEMMGIALIGTPALPGDENLINDTTSVKPAYNNCNFRNTPTNIKHRSFNNIWSNIYPNPSDNILFIKRNSGGNGVINIYDTQGKLLVTEPTYNEIHTVNISALSSGIYYVEIKTESVTQRQKIVVNR